MEQQKEYAELSLTELAAFVCWRRGPISRARYKGAPKIDLKVAWDLLECEDQSQWFPDDPRSALAADPTWAQLLAEVDVL